jgi:hypothetical protein
MMAGRIYSKLLTRRYSGGDRTAAVRSITYRVGRLYVQALPNYRYALMTNLEAGSTFSYVWGGSATSPQVLRRIKIANVSGGSTTVRLAMKTTNTGSPTTANVFLLWDFVIANNTVWEWEGAVVFQDRYLYAYGTRGGIGLYMEWEQVKA